MTTSFKSYDSEHFYFNLHKQNYSIELIVFINAKINVLLMIISSSSFFSFWQL